MKTIAKVMLFLLIFSLFSTAAHVEAAGIKPPITINTLILGVTKTAQASFDREYIWDLSKVADQTYLLLMPGQVFTVNYDVTAWVTDVIDTDITVSGTITVQNIGIMTPYITSIEESIPGAVITCDYPLPGYLSPGHIINCTYSAVVTGDVPATNTVSVYRQINSEGDTELAAQTTVPVTLVPGTVVNECVDLTDTLYGDMGEVCAEDSPYTVSYSHDFVGGEECTLVPTVNTATLTLDDLSTIIDEWTVEVETPCDEGCSLTQGYWKTHSIYGPAPYDDTWALIGENTQFFGNVGTSWYQMLWLNPRGGNAYVILAKQYIAAVLNELNGADVSIIAVTMGEAEYWLNTYTFDYHFTKDEKAIMTALASTLDQYNRGLIGPGHCSE